MPSDCWNEDTVIWFILRFIVMAVVLLSYIGFAVVVVDAFNLDARWLLVLIPLGVVAAMYYLLRGVPSEATHRRNQS